jgi:predicted neutral ceramidase superfamily lipid hydrolase
VIEWFTWVQGAFAAVVALVAFSFAAMKRTPNDYTLGGTVLIGVLLVGQIVVAIAAPILGNSATGDPLGFWMYLITAIMMIPAAVIWAVVERTVISNVILGVVAASVAVMVARMNEIWFA